MSTKSLMEPDARITRLSRVVVWVTTILIGVLPPGIVAYVLLLPEQIVHWRSVAPLRLSSDPFLPEQAAAVIAVLLFYSLPSLWGLWEMRALFRGYAAGEIFTLAMARRLRRCAMALLILAPAGPVAGVGLSLALSIGQMPGKRMLVLGIGSDDLGHALIGLALLIVAQVMVRAAKLAEENQGFV